VLNFDKWIGAEEEPWEDKYKEIEENWTDFLNLKAPNPGAFKFYFRLLSVLTR